MAKVVKGLRAGNTKTARQEWETLVTSMVQGNALPVDINALMQSVLRESYLETNKDLQFHADKVKFFNEVKTDMRNPPSHVAHR